MSGFTERRAQSVADFLKSQGVPPQPQSYRWDWLSACLLAPNDTASSAQQNRRVELIISGAVIGIKVGAAKIQP